MPVDPSKIRNAVDKNDAVTDGVKAMSKNLENLNPRNFEQTSTAARQWAGNVRGLKESLQEQQQLTRAMRESARIQDEAHGDSFRDQYRFIVDRMKADIRHFFHELQKFVDLPQDFQHQQTWDHCQYDMESGLKGIPAQIGESSVSNLEPLVQLMNYRDNVISLLLNGLIYKKAVLDWDLKSNRPYADKPMCDMFEEVANIHSKTETVPAKLVARPPVHSEEGPFTAKELTAEKGMELSALQLRLCSVLNEMQQMDKGLRNMKFGQQVTIPLMHKGASKTQTVAADELRHEVTKWYQKCMALQEDLQKSKALRHQASELQVEQLTAKCEEKEQFAKKQVSRVHKLEGDIQNLKHELSNLRREKQEYAEKNAKMMKENLPVLDKIEKLLAKSQEAVDRLTADAELLSSMFRIQVQENRQNVEAMTKVRHERDQLKKQLDEEMEKNKDKQTEIQKKETLYLRTMAARKHIHESYLEQKQKITEVETAMSKREAEKQEMLRVLEGRESENRQLRQDLANASRRIDELEQHKKLCLDEYRKAVGKPCNLIEHFKAISTADSPVGGS